MKQETDFLKQLLPKLPQENRWVKVAMGWGMLVLWPVWLPLALLYAFSVLLYALGDFMEGFLLDAVKWLSSAEERRHPNGNGHAYEEEGRPS